jgi:hypothetical protein
MLRFVVRGNLGKSQRAACDKNGAYKGGTLSEIHIAPLEESKTAPKQTNEKVRNE